MFSGSNTSRKPRAGSERKGRGGARGAVCVLARLTESVDGVLQTVLAIGHGNDLQHGCVRNVARGGLELPLRILNDN